MGFFFRKSLNFGPFRLNFSKSGIGVSAGIKGVRVSTGPKGTYINAGSNGFYYRQRIDSYVGNTKNQTQNSNTKPQSFHSQNDGSQQSTVENADVDQLRETSSNEVLDQINSAAKKIRLAPFAFLSAIALASFSYKLFPAIVGLISIALGSPISVPYSSLIQTSAIAAGLVGFGLGLVVTWRIHIDDTEKRTISLFYELDQKALAEFSNVQYACGALSHACRVWSIQTEFFTADRKRNAGASTLLTRHVSSMQLRPPKNILTNVDVWSLSVSGLTLFFMPDKILVLQKGKYGSLSYRSLRAIFSTTRFIEAGGVPGDAHIVDYTWRYVNKDGSPDRRFSNNNQIPIAQYGLIQIESSRGLKVHLQVSSVEAASRFVNNMSASFARNVPRPESRANGTENSRSSNKISSDTSKAQSAYQTLGVEIGSSWEAITAAYRRMAKMYHPDRLAGLAPEFVALAEERMKDINIAYQTLKNVSDVSY
ncbi:hypothetical protein BH10ACI2_BH10ACI2_07520 [soil metagenome]